MNTNEARGKRTTFKTGSSKGDLKLYIENAMKRFLVKKLPAVSDSQDKTCQSILRLSEEEARHAKKVLRLDADEIVEVMDGYGMVCQGQIRVYRESVFIECLSTNESPYTIVPVILEVAVLKLPAMEWLIEKSVELGIRKLVPLWTERCVVKNKGKTIHSKFLERWNRIAEQSLKQCGRATRLEIAVPVPMKSLDISERLEKNPILRIWCDELERMRSPQLLSFLNEYHSKTKLDQGIRFIVGPEGGWSDGEREMLQKTQANRVSLGSHILRSETAAVFGISILRAFFCNLNKM